uniref:Uncharacterized protein n=1 Tax=Sus scrofa TaxID=9823 RepID=A0A8D0ZYY0_PIG
SCGVGSIPGPGTSVKPHLEEQTLGIHSHPRIIPTLTEVIIIEEVPAGRHINCLLRANLQNFYLITDGFHMTWRVKLVAHTIPLSCMAINSISKLTQLSQPSMHSTPNAPTLADLEDDTQENLRSCVSD